jgi:hypothetical protein
MATHKKKDALMILSREMAQAATGMAAGVMNYLGGRPPISSSIHLFSFLLPKDQLTIEIHSNKKTTPIIIATGGGHVPKKECGRVTPDTSIIEKITTSVPLIKIAFARSGDKGDHANIGVIARRPEFLPYIQNELSSDAVAKYFSHVLDGEVFSWDVPGINGLNFLLKNSLGGGGMASLNIDPQGKAYAQQLLEYEIPIDGELILDL